MNGSLGTPTWSAIPKKAPPALAGGRFALRTSLPLVAPGLAHMDEDPAAKPTTQPPPSITVVGEQAARAASDKVIERDLIQAAPHRTAGDLLLLVPGMFITQHSGLGKAYQVFYRGFDSVHGQDIEFWVGGAPVNEVSNVHGQGYADLHFVMPEVVSGIVATPGTYDPRQGDFAVAGSVRFELGYNEPGATAKASTGTYGERRYFFAYHPVDAPESTFAAFETHATNGFGPARAERRSSAIGQHVFDLGSGATLRVLATTFTSRFDSAGVLRLDDLDNRVVERFSSYDSKQGGFSSRSQLVLDFHKDEGESGWSVTPYFILRSLKLRSDYTGYLIHKDDGDSIQQTNDATTFGATTFYRRRVALLAKNDAVEVGVSMRNDWIDQSQRDLNLVNDIPIATPVLAKIRATDVAGYLDTALHPFRGLVVRAGIRIDGLAYSVEDDSPAAGRSTRVGSGGTVLDPTAAGAARAAMGAHLGKKLSLDYRIIGALHVIGSYGEGFRSPQARSLGEGERTPFTSVKSWELGVRFRDNETIKASAGVFYTSLSGDLVFDPTTARNESVPATRRIGAAFDLVAHPTRWFVSSTSLTYTRATFTASDSVYSKGELLPYIPQIISRSDIAFIVPLAQVWRRTLVGRIGAAFTSLVNRPLPYGERGHDIFLVDLLASVRLKELELGIDVYNLLGAQWFDGEFVFASTFNRGAPPSLVPARHVTVGAPRTALATLSIYL